MKRLFFLLLLSACRSGVESPAGADVLARVYDKELTLDKVLPLIPENLSAADSTEFVKNFVDSWIRDMVIVYQAEQTLPEEARNVEARLENYRRSLLVYAYEHEFARQKLDTMVSDEEIEKHYNENQQEFTLADFIVKVLYVKLEKNQPGKEKVARWYKSTAQNDLIELEKYCAEHAVNYYNDPESWIYFSDLLKEIPIETDDRTEFLKNTKHLNFDDEEFSYYLTIYDYHLKDAVSPLSFEKENIKARILNTRTTGIVRKMRTDLLQEAQPEIKNYVKD